MKFAVLVEVEVPDEATPGLVGVVRLNLECAARKLVRALWRDASVEASASKEMALLAFYCKAKALEDRIGGVTSIAHAHGFRWPEGDEFNWTKERVAVEEILERIAPSTERVCATCHGHGLCVDCDHGLRGGKPCQSCGGTGRCWVCHGTGQAKGGG